MSRRSAVRVRIVALRVCYFVPIYKQITKARMSEWSKEPDLRPGSVSCVGSNPTSCNLYFIIQILNIMYLILCI